MIKHEEARSFLCLLPAKLKDFYSDYITEQKKKDELIDLYREINKLTLLLRDCETDTIDLAYFYDRLRQVRQQIKALEEALK